MKANPVFRNFFLKLVGAKWFERAWCMHEMRLSQGHVFLIRCDDEAEIRNGTKSPPTVLRFTGLFLIHMMGLAIPSDLSPDRVRPLLEVFGAAVIKKLGGKGDLSSYTRTFADTFRQQAGGNPVLDTIARKHDANLDKLSIAINTIGLGISVTRAISVEAQGTIDKSLPPATPDECCRRFITLAIAAADPGTLCSTGAELQLADTSRTWMRWPLYTDIGIHSEKMVNMGTFSIEFDPSPAATYVGLDMWIFNGGEEGSRAGGVRWASERKLRICRAFKEGCESRRMYSVHYNVKYGEKLKPLETRKALIRTLAAVMECGIPWVLYMADNVLQSWNKILLVNAVQRLLDHEKINFTRGREKEPFDTKFMDSPVGRKEAEILLDLARMLIHTSLPWGTEQSMAAYEAVCIVNSSSTSVKHTKARETAFMFAQMPDSGSNVDVVCATPMVLLQDGYSELFRGWTLVKGAPEKETDDSGVEKWKFHLLGKSRIYGTILAAGCGTAGSSHYGKKVTGVRMYGPG
jgi:hypothetical protein